MRALLHELSPSNLDCVTQMPKAGRGPCCIVDVIQIAAAEFVNMAAWHQKLSNANSSSTINAPAGADGLGAMNCCGGSTRPSAPSTDRRVWPGCRRRQGVFSEAEETATGAPIGRSTGLRDGGPAGASI